jgi:hypothetical protein
MMLYHNTAWYIGVIAWLERQFGLAVRQVDAPARSPRSCGCEVNSSVIRPKPQCGGSPENRPISPDAAMRDAAAVLRQRQTGIAWPSGRARATCSRRSTTSAPRRTQKVVAQTRSRLAGVMVESAHRLVSLHDVDASPMRKGRLGKPVEFGYEAQIVDNTEGITTTASKSETRSMPRN